MEKQTVKYQKLDPRAQAPEYATAGAAAADLHALLDAPMTVAPMQRVLVPTGLAIELPGPGAVALVYARSGLALKRGLGLANGVGVIDSDYRGEVHIPVTSEAVNGTYLEQGERIAQLGFFPVHQLPVRIVDSLPETERGDGGIGSTGNT